MTAKANKPKSPPTPSRSLGDCVADVERIYGEYSHGKFARAEIASQLSVSAGSGPFAARLFSLKEFGLLTQTGTDYSVSDLFMTLRAAPSEDPKFKTAALGAIRKSDVFRELLDEFKTKLPSKEAVAGRLETQKKFNADRAKATASVLEKSLRYAGVLDSSNNILPVRDQGGSNEPDEGKNGVPGHEVAEEQGLPTDTLTMEIPVGEGRRVVVRYPQDLSSEDAAKVGNVLKAIVS